MPDSMTLEEKLSVIDSIPPTKGIFGFEAVTEKTTINGGVLQKSRFTAAPTPSRFLEITTKFRGTVFMGDDYATMVNKVREKEGVRPDFEASPTYCAPVSENNLIFEHKKSGQLYLRVYLGYGATMNGVTEYFDAHGIQMSAAEYKNVKEEYLKKSGDNAKQGLVETVEVKNYKIENVVRLHRGETWLDKESARC